MKSWRIIVDQLYEDKEKDKIRNVWYPEKEESEWSKQDKFSKNRSHSRGL